jgi:hypothetical protein
MSEDIEKIRAYGGTFSLFAYLPAVEEGLDFLLGHFEAISGSCDIWPRTISTRTTQGKQILVYNREDALTRFKQANLLDCRISAYPSSKYSRRQQAPSLLFIDLDSKALDLDKELKQTVTNIKIFFEDDNIEPTVLWSGKGYHIYLPVDAMVLEHATGIFDDIEVYDPSRKFMQWSEQFLSDNKADPCHSRGVSFNNCMLRVPGSINSKVNEQVRIIQRWNGVRPSIHPLLYDFYIDLADTKIREVQGVKTANMAPNVYAYWRTKKK